jgi:hypothetical protein
LVKLRVSEVGITFFSLDNLRRDSPFRRTCEIQIDVPKSIPGLSSPFNVQFTSLGYNRKVIWSSSGFLRSGSHSFPWTTFVVTVPSDGRVISKFTFPSRYQVFPVLSTYNLLHADIIEKLRRLLLYILSKESEGGMKSGEETFFGLEGGFYTLHFITSW